ncbi:hypothetical protein K505DRAFT_330413 [Melanomma pulvis-pyrius CBS 109.77]|uniref:Uncharacterized protein n=1 Tax=Melanomma pulvis-pyrius CBS 109.77 TaxID=1314802 RepID=A0A6A6WQJ0_9PLEO|nr:hypothetical protein K505DRAFT_330413 [Melanomma pulvis-pyrius CBS 109.77]
MVFCYGGCSATIGWTLESFSLPKKAAMIDYNSEHILGAAKVTKSPIIAEFFPWAVMYSLGRHILSPHARPHRSPLDHAQDYEL